MPKTLPPVCSISSAHNSQMPALLADVDRSVLVIVDMQPKFLRVIDGQSKVLDRCQFLARCARSLEVPILFTEQNADRMGHTDSALQAIEDKAIDKLCFSCWASETFQASFKALGRNQAVIVGIETPICIAQTALQLLDNGIQVVIGADATGARSAEAHAVALARMAAAGAVIATSDSIVYEWLGTAAHPRFRDVLQLMKE